MTIHKALDEERLVWDYACTINVTIDRPANEVWPYFFGEKEESWTEDHYTRVAGQPGRVGEIYWASHPLGGRVFFEATKVDPESELILKITWALREGDQRQVVGYDLIELRETAGRTAVSLRQVLALPVAVPKDRHAAEAEKQTQMLTRIFQNLKRLVEGALKQ
jgi:hypothetical protein